MERCRAAGDLVALRKGCLELVDVMVELRFLLVGHLGGLIMYQPVCVLGHVYQDFA